MDHETCKYWYELIFLPFGVIPKVRIFEVIILTTSRDLLEHKSMSKKGSKMKNGENENYCYSMHQSLCVRKWMAYIFEQVNVLYLVHNRSVLVFEYLKDIKQWEAIESLKCWSNEPCVRTTTQPTLLKGQGTTLFGQIVEKWFSMSFLKILALQIFLQGNNLNGHVPSCSS